MSDEAIIAQVSAILEGWTPTPGKALANRAGDNWLIGGFIDGTCFYKHTGLAPDGPDTPDDPIEAAHWLVAHVAALRGSAPEAVIPEQETTLIEEIREAYEESHADDKSQNEMGFGVPALDGPGGDVEATQYAGDDDDANSGDASDQLSALKESLRLRVIAEAVRQSGLSANVLERVIELTKTLNDENTDEEVRTSAQLELEQHNEYREKATLVEAAKQRKLAEIEAIETVEDALAYSVEDGWP